MATKSSDLLYRLIFPITPDLTCDQIPNDNVQLSIKTLRFMPYPKLYPSTPILLASCLNITADFGSWYCGAQRAAATKARKTKTYKHETIIA